MAFWLSWLHNTLPCVLIYYGVISCLDSDLSVNLSSSDTLQTYLSALSEDSVTDRPTTSDQSSLTAGVIAAIVISVGLVFIVTVVVISVLSIKLYQRSKHSKSL